MVAAHLGSGHPRPSGVSARCRRPPPLPTGSPPALGGPSAGHPPPQPRSPGSMASSVARAVLAGPRSGGPSSRPANRSARLSARAAARQGAPAAQPAGQQQPEGPCTSGEWTAGRAGWRPAPPPRCHYGALTHLPDDPAIPTAPAQFSPQPPSHSWTQPNGGLAAVVEQGAHCAVPHTHTSSAAAASNLASLLAPLCCLQGDGTRWTCRCSYQSSNIRQQGRRQHKPRQPPWRRRCCCCLPLQHMLARRRRPTACWSL